MGILREGKDIWVDFILIRPFYTFQTPSPIVHKDELLK
jgi:hypothetical protein